VIGWRWFAAHGAALGAVLLVALGWTLFGEGDPGGGRGAGLLWGALGYCGLAGLVTALRTRRILDAAAVGLVAGPAGCALGLLGIAAITRDAHWLTGLVVIPGVALLGALIAAVGGGVARPLRRMLDRRAGQR
jgi:hypothetical protein